MHLHKLLKLLNAVCVLVYMEWMLWFLVYRGSFGDRGNKEKFYHIEPLNYDDHSVSFLVASIVWIHTIIVLGCLSMLEEVTNQLYTTVPRVSCHWMSRLTPPIDSDCGGDVFMYSCVLTYNNWDPTEILYFAILNKKSCLVIMVLFSVWHSATLYVCINFTYVDRGPTCSVLGPGVQPTGRNMW